MRSADSRDTEVFDDGVRNAVELLMSITCGDPGSVERGEMRCADRKKNTEKPSPEITFLRLEKVGVSAYATAQQ